MAIRPTHIRRKEKINFALKIETVNDDLFRQSNQPDKEEKKDGVSLFVKNARGFNWFNREAPASFSC